MNNSIDTNKVISKLKKNFNIIINAATEADTDILEQNDNSYIYIKKYYLIENKGNKRFLQWKNIININANNEILSKKIDIIKNDFVNEKIDKSFFEDCYK